MEQKFCPYCMTPVTPGEPCPVCGLTEGSYSPSPHHIPPGTVLQGRYLVGRVLGEGGFGITYIGCDLRLELKVAIKEYYPLDRAARNASESLDVVRFTGNAGKNYETGKERFLYEARTMARMDKLPQIVNVRDFFESNNTAYIIMEYVAGTTLKELVNQRGRPIDPQELLSMLRPLFKALEEMHSVGLIHRDISPDNLMLENGNIRLIDFGCARESANGERTMTVVLKQGYAPIEQYQQQGQGPWTDVYALAATMYFCLTGKVPPRSVERITEDTLVPPRKLGVELTAFQERALMQALRFLPRQRTRSIAEFADALYNPMPDLPTPRDSISPRKVSKAPIRPQEDVLIPDEEVQAKAPSIDAPRKPAASKAAAPAPKKQVDNEDIPLESKAPAAPKRRTPKKQSLSWKKLWWLAPVAVCLVCLLLIPRGEEAKPATEPAAATEAAFPQVDFSDPYLEAVQEKIAEAQVFSGSDAHFRELMSYENVPAVIIPAGSIFTVADQPLVVNKPLIIEEGAHLNAQHSVVIEEGGYIQVEGMFCSEAMVRTNGGRIALTSTGSLEIYDMAVLLMEQESDLMLLDGAAVNENTSQKIRIFSEEETFRNATHVTTLQDLYAAMDNWRTTAIVIDGDITLEDHRVFNVPLMVSPGVTLSAPMPDYWPGGFPTAVVTYPNAPLVNYGTISGGHLVASFDENAAGEYLILNHGTIDGSFLYTTNGWDDEVPAAGIPTGMLFNFGTLETACAAFGYIDIYNTGTVTYNGAQDAFFVVLEANVFNGGDWNVNGRMQYSGKYKWFTNSGHISVGENSTLENAGRMQNYGTMAITQPGSQMCNLGLIEVGRGRIAAKSGGAWVNDGIVTVSHQSIFSVDREVGSGYRIGYAAGEYTHTTNWVRYVNTEAELQMWNADSECMMMVMNTGEIHLTKDFVLRKPLIIIEDGNFYGDGHNLTVERPGALCVKGLGFDMGGGKLTLRQTPAYFDSLPNSSCWDIQQQGLVMILNGGGLKDTTVNASNLTVLGIMDLTDCEVNVPAGGILRNLGELNIDSGKVTLDSGGTLITTQADLRVNPSGTLENNGSLEINNGFINYVFQINGTYTQAGYAQVNGCYTDIHGLADIKSGTFRFFHNLRVYNLLRNKGRLEPQNGAEILLLDGGALE